jgi:hypothetical protein
MLCQWIPLCAIAPKWMCHLHITWLCEDAHFAEIFACVFGILDQYLLPDCSKLVRGALLLGLVAGGAFAVKAALPKKTKAAAPAKSATAPAPAAKKK